MRISCLVCSCFLLSLLACSPGAPAAAVTSRAASTAPSNLIHRSHESSVAGAFGNDSAGAETGAGAARVVFSLAAVVGLILVVYFMVRRLGGGNALGAFGGGSSQPIRVISRVAISSKQRLLLIGVGRRMLVVADNGQRLGTLCEIDDPEEVEELIGLLDARRAASAANPGIASRANWSAFKSRLPRPVMRSTKRIERDTDELTGAQQEIEGLLHRVRGIARQADGA